MQIFGRFGEIKDGSPESPNANHFGIFKTFTAGGYEMCNED